MDILKLLQQSGALKQMMKQYGLDEGQIASIIKSSMPEISKAIKNNTSSKQGLEDFMKAIKEHENDDVESMLEDINKIDTNDGNKILGHIFGDRKSEVEERVAKEAGVKKDNSKALIALMIPIILSMLGKSAKQRKVTQDVEVNRRDSRIDDIGDIFGQRQARQPQYDRDIFGDIRGNQYQAPRTEEEKRGGLIDIVGGLLDKDHDGSLIDDLGGILGKFL